VTGGVQYDTGKFKTFLLVFKLQPSRDLAEEKIQVEIRKIFMAETEHVNIHSKLLGQILTFSGPRNQNSLLIFQLLEKIDKRCNPPPHVPWRSVNK
jgi:hypothetical protein